MVDTAGLDGVWIELKPFGKFTVINYALILFPCYLSGMYASVYNFEAMDIDYRCKIPECEDHNASTWLHYAIPKKNDKFDKCGRYQMIDGNSTCDAGSFNSSVIKCEDYVYSDEDSVVKDFNLGCQNWKRSSIGTIHNAGLFVSLPLYGMLSDRYGRKNILAITSLLNGIMGLLRSFSVSYEMLVATEFLEAALGKGVYSTAFVLAMELVQAKGRVFGNTLLNFAYIFGVMTLSLLAWWLQNWRHMLRIIYTPSVFAISFVFILTESPRWLLSKGRNEEAISIIRRAEKMNNVKLSEDLIESLKDKIVDSKKEFKKEETLLTVMAKLIKSKTILLRVIVCSYMWITCTFSYYGLSINSVSLAGNKYLNFLLVGFVEMPANIVCLMVLDRFGRKKVLIITFALSAVFCIGLSFISEGDSIWPLILYLSGKFAITVAYSSVYVYVSEVFPTEVRQSLLAVCSMVGRVGSLLAPLTPMMELYYKNLPAIFFGVFSFLASVLVLTIPETINTTLPDTIEEAEKISKDNINK